jgi:hypothetical protein
MQPRLPTCENTLKWVIEQAIPSLESSFVTRRIPVFRCGASPLTFVIQGRDRLAASSERYASAASTPVMTGGLQQPPGSTCGQPARCHGVGEVVAAREALALGLDPHLQRTKKCEPVSPRGLARAMSSTVSSTGPTGPSLTRFSCRRAYGCCEDEGPNWNASSASWSSNASAGWMSLGPAVSVAEPWPVGAAEARTARRAGEMVLGTAL